MSSSIEGTCLCGEVGYRIRGDILGFQYCHCSRCRRFTGSAHASNCFVRPDALQWTRGEDQVRTFMLDAEPGFPTGFCTNCGSSLPALSSTGRFWVVPAGTLTADPGARPAQSIFWASRAPWFIDGTELPRYDELPTKSG